MEPTSTSYSEPVRQSIVDQVSLLTCPELAATDSTSSCVALSLMEKDSWNALQLYVRVTVSSVPSHTTPSSEKEPCRVTPPMVLVITKVVFGSAECSMPDTVQVVSSSDKPAGRAGETEQPVISFSIGAMCTWSYRA